MGKATNGMADLIRARSCPDRAGQNSSEKSFFNSSSRLLLPSTSWLVECRLTVNIHLHLLSEFVPRWRIQPSHPHSALTSQSCMQERKGNGSCLVRESSITNRCEGDASGPLAGNLPTCSSGLRSALWTCSAIQVLLSKVEGGENFGTLRHCVKSLKTCSNTSTFGMR